MVGTRRAGGLRALPVALYPARFAIVLFDGNGWLAKESTRRHAEDILACLN
jgi:hypothetical protein